VIPVLLLVVVAIIMIIVAARAGSFRRGYAIASGSALLALMMFVGLRGGWGGAITIAVISGVAALVWFLLFSGRVRTATPAFRARILHVIFALFFTGYALWIAVWLIAGAVTSATAHSESLHARMHAYGGVPDVQVVEADAIAPFRIDGSTRIREMTFRAGDTGRIDFLNSPADADASCTSLCTAADRERGTVAIKHNISIYQAGGDAIFKGDPIQPSSAVEAPPATITYTFDVPVEGTYVYRCDFHPASMHGRVLVLPSSAPVTHPSVSAGIRDNARHIAEVSHEAEGSRDAALDYAFSFVSFGLGVFLVLLRPKERMARVFGVAMIGTAAAYNLQSHAALATADSFDQLHFYLHPITGISYIYALVLFPDGRLLPRFSNRAVAAVYRVAFFFATLMLLGVTGSALPDFNQHPAALVLMFGMVIPVIGMIAQSLRMRRAPTSEARQQSRLLLIALGASFALGLIVLLAVGIDLGALINPNRADPTAIGPASARAFRVFQPLFVVIPLALFAGILRFRLWDIDLVIKRTIVYGALAGFIGAVYVAVVVGIGGAVGGRTGLSIAATVLVAVAFDPLRSRLQRLANRLVYGERASPYEVMADLSHRLADAKDPAGVLPATAEAVARGVGAVRARATLFLPSGARHVGVFPAEEDDDLAYDRVLPLSHQGEDVGELAIGKRAGDPLRGSENRLLEAVGSQVAIAFHSLGLAERLRARLDDLGRTTAQLAASRGRIVNAQDAERSRLERDIHARVESPLVAISATIDEAERAMRHGDAGAVELIDRAAAEANRVQDALRDVARGVFPPLLADRGVVSALEGHSRKIGAIVAVRAADRESRFDPNAEAAVYFCCIEAIGSAAGRAAGSRIEVTIASDDGWITFEVRDRAHGLSEAALSGPDLQLMVDRIEAVGGRLEVHVAPEGTTVSGRVPAQPFALAHTSASLSGSNEDFGT
jgi:signal transduction histidine kinase